MIDDKLRVLFFSVTSLPGAVPKPMYVYGYRLSGSLGPVYDTYIACSIYPPFPFHPNINPNPGVEH